MLRPFLSIRQEELYHHIVELDTAKQFYVRVEYNFSEVFISETNEIESKNPLSKEFINAIESIGLPNNKIYFLSYNAITEECKNALKSLVESLGQNKKSAELINYLLVTNNTSNSTCTIEFVEPYRFPQSTITEKIELINDLLHNRSWYLYRDSYQDFYIKNSDYKCLDRDNILIYVSELLEKNSDYYRIEIYGEKNYTIYNPLLLDIETITGIKLYNTTLTEREYNDMIQFLR